MDTQTRETEQEFVGDVGDVIPEDTGELLDRAALNINAIAEMEKKALETRTFVTRFGDAITSRLGTMTAVIVHIAVITAWCIVNLNVIPGVKAFDPYPFGLMTMFVSIEGVLVAIFVLITQNRMSRQADRRAHLNLQVDMLAEQEMTRVLKMLKMLCDHNGLREEEHEEAVQQLLEETNVQQLAEKLEETLPE